MINQYSINSIIQQPHLNTNTVDNMNNDNTNSNNGIR